MINCQEYPLIDPFDFPLFRTRLKRHPPTVYSLRIVAALFLPSLLYYRYY